MAGSSATTSHPPVRFINNQSYLSLCHTNCQHQHLMFLGSAPDASGLRKMNLLTKSKYMIGLQCPKYLWMVFHEPEKIPKPDKAQQHVFDEGHLVGELAKKLFPQGIDIPTEPFAENLKKSSELLSKKKPLFEAAFSSGQLYSRADILFPVKNEWDIIEVKMSTEVKEEHIQDVAFQKYVYENAGLKINKCFLMHVDNEYVRKGKINPKKLFVKEDISKDVNDIKNIPAKIEEMFEVINSKECPASVLGRQCKKPYECPVEEECWQLPDGSVFELYNARGKEFELYEKGIVSLKDIPDEFKLNDKQGIQKKCAKTGEVHINKAGIKSFLARLKYPLYYLDFETFGSAIPFYDKSSPYQQIPFQFSLHVDDGKNVRHCSFIASGKEDPRKEFVSSLKKVLGTKGSIVVYNQSFEIARLKEIAEFLPSYRKWVNSTIKRVVDLLVPFRNFDYYNPVQQGSCSIKHVLPALTGKGYKELEIHDGGSASLAFLDIAFSKISDKEKTKLRADLEKYCCLDTEGMVWIVEKIKKISSI